jgi:hypothetical protein
MFSMPYKRTVYGAVRIVIMAAAKNGLEVRLVKSGPYSCHERKVTMAYMKCAMVIYTKE